MIEIDEWAHARRNGQIEPCPIHGDEDCEFCLGERCETCGDTDCGYDD